MAKAVIFDLDNTLFDTTEQLTEQAREAAFRAMIKAGLNKPLEELLQLKDEIVRKNGANVPVLRAICEELKISNPDILDAGLNAFYGVEVKELELFSDVRDTVEKLKEKGMKLAIVTTGSTELQNKKIDVLRIRKYFDVILINEVKDGEDKKHSLMEALVQLNVKPKDVLSVGDRVDDEIKISNGLGMKTAWFVHGKYSVRGPKDSTEQPAYTINRISDILKIVK